MIKKATEYIKKKWVIFLIFNLILVFILHFLLVIPLRIVLGIPVINGIEIGGFNHDYIEKKLTNVEEKIFLKKFFDIELNNEYAKFDDNIRVGVNGVAEDDGLFTFGKEEYIYHYGFITFTGNFNNSESRIAFLKKNGVTEEEIAENKYIYYVDGCEIHTRGDVNYFSIIIKKKLDRNQYYHHKISAGNSIVDLDKAESLLDYMWTISKIINKNFYFKAILLLLLEFAVAVAINLFIIIIKIFELDKR